MLQKSFTNKFLKTLNNVDYGRVSVTMPDGKRDDFQGKHDGTHAKMTINDWRAIPAFAARGDIGLAESYRDGLWDTDDLTKLFLVGLENQRTFDGYIYGNVLSQIKSRFLYLLSRNTLRGSKKNIHAHYDLGNAFYQLWLDATMSYSSALFLNPDDTLEQAQNHKYDRILSRFDKKSDKLLEIGCGWGGFAMRAADTSDFDITGITISDAQYDYATDRLGNKAKIVRQDYRDTQGQYDGIISIEMFEAVGEEFWGTYFNKIKSLLSPTGKAIIQTITIDDKYFERYRKTGDMIRSFIFPGGMLPSPSRFCAEAQKAGLRVTDSFGFGQDYARTLTQWLNQFDANISQVKKLGFDESFIRIWRFYLCYCTASFRAGRTDVMQFELGHI